jgi:hypothetical protein
MASDRGREVFVGAMLQSVVRRSEVSLRRRRDSGSSSHGRDVCCVCVGFRV